MSSDATGAKPPAAIDRMSGELRKADLQDAATQLFSERGYDGSSLQEIADRIGILKGSVYYYYQSKEDLLFDIVKAIHDEHLENVRMLAARPGDPMQRLHAVLVGHAIFVCDNLVKTTVFLKSMDSFAAMNEVYGKPEYFGAHPPARSTVEVARLPRDVLVEIEIVALA